MTTATPQRLTAILYREDEVYVAECPEVGTASQGDTIEEALANLREATELYLEECPQPALAPRLLTTFEVNVASAAGVRSHRRLAASGLSSGMSERQPCGAAKTVKQP